MAGYRELAEGYTLDVTEQGGMAQRVFITDAAGTDTLPTYGQVFSTEAPDSNYAFLRMRRIVKTIYGKQDVFKYTCHYSSPNMSVYNPNDDTIHIGTKDYDNLQTSMQFGGEVITLDVEKDSSNTDKFKNPTFKWETGTDTTVRVPVPIRIPSGSFIIPLKVTDDIATFNGIALPILGRVNDATFKGFPAQTVLYTGHTAIESYDDGEGAAQAKFWNVELQFSFRIVPLQSGYGGWNHFIRRYKTGDTITEGWDRILFNITGTKPIYQLADLNDLLA